MCIRFVKSFSCLLRYIDNIDIDIDNIDENLQININIYTALLLKANNWICEWDMKVLFILFF